MKQNSSVEEHINDARCPDSTVMKLDNQEEHSCIYAMMDYLVETYYNSDAMKKVLSGEIIVKLECGMYSAEEIKIMYEWATRKYDALLAL
ncbi:hypothetical protein [Methanolobus sp.]|uniref:hypothetical protein n=1 Tax=Methanolobus sp. TaxID=1874737 RepID=UPI0025E7D2F1|nr:hypothetical protein [Methanolobus sp.]